MSLAILYSDTARVRSVPDSWTSASCAPLHGELIGCGYERQGGEPRDFGGGRFANPGAALIPVPTAVPPRPGSRSLEGGLDALQIVREHARIA